MQTCEGMARGLHTHAALVALALCAAGARARADGRIGRGTIGLFVGGGTLIGGDYNDRIARWGFRYSTARYAGLSGGVFVTPWLLVGGRLAWTNADGREARWDNASLTLSMVDLGALARVGFREVSASTRWFFGAQAEVGGAWAWSTLRERTDARLIPRFGAGLFVQLFLGRFGVGFSVVQRIAPWADVDRRGTTLDLGGTEFTGSLEARL